MDHDLSVGQSEPLALGAAGQQECAHRGSHAHADGGDIALDILDGIVDGHTRADGAAGAVDIQADVLIGVLPFQIQQLCHDKAGRGVVDILAQHNDAVVQQTGENIVGTLPVRRLLDNVRNKTHRVRLLNENYCICKIDRYGKRTWAVAVSVNFNNLSLQSRDHSLPCVTLCARITERPRSFRPQRPSPRR